MRKRLDLVCPDCKGNRKEKSGEPCLLCGGTGVFSDVDTQEEFTRKYAYSG